MEEVQELEVMENRQNQNSFLMMALLLLCISCGNNIGGEVVSKEQGHSTKAIDSSVVSDQEENDLIDFNQEKEYKFIPDTSLNKIFYLLEPVEYKKINAILNNRNTLNEETTVLNDDMSQQLKLFQSLGGGENEFRYFKVSYSNKEYLDSTEVFNIDIKEFVTGLGVTLGINKSKLVNIMGKSYIEEVKDEKITLTYVVDDYLKTPFLIRYNMPVYQAYYVFKDDQLIEFGFGFEAP